MKKIILFILLVTANLGFSQFNFNFGFQHTNGSPIATTGNHVYPGISNLHLINVDLSQSVCEGQTINITNSSSGTYMGYSITGTTLWDAKWGVWTAGPTSWSTSTTPFNDLIWNPIQTITIPTTPPAGNVYMNSGNDPNYSYYHLFVAPNLNGHYGGVYNSTAGCSRVIVLKLKVKKAPLCITDKKVCDDSILTNAFLGINAGTTATNWTPSDPRVTSLTEGLYTVTLSNGSCTVNCSFNIEFTNPFQDLILDQVLCSNDLPYMSQFIYDSYPYSISVNGVLVLDQYAIITNPSYFDATQDHLLFTDPGNYQVVLNYYQDSNGNSVECSKTYDLNISSPINFNHMPSNFIFCNDPLDICGPTAPNGSTYTYAWYGPSPTGNQSILLSTADCYTPQNVGGYNLVVTDENGCSSNHAFTVTDQLPSVELGHDIIICEGDFHNFPSINILNQGFDNGNFVITWYQNGTVIQNGGTVLQMTPTTGTISVVITSPGSGCNSAIDQIEITRKVCCPEEVNIGIILCRGEEPIFHVLNQGFDNPNVTIMWYFQGQVIQEGGEILETSIFGDGELTVVIQKEGCPEIRDTITISCGINGPYACFDLLNPRSLRSKDSLYGPMEIKEYCKGSPIILDGSCSQNENGYHLRISKFNLTTWTFIQDIFNGWVSGTGTAPNNINLNNFGIYETGYVYLVALSVGPVWASSPPQFFSVFNCPVNRIETKEVEHTENLIKVDISPNPTNDIININLNKTTTGKLDIYSLEGKLIISKEFSELNQLEASLKGYSNGIYIVRITSNGNTITKKIIKE